jgi:hypothetical protein
VCVAVVIVRRHSFCSRKTERIAWITPVCWGVWSGLLYIGVKKWGRVLRSRLVYPRLRELKDPSNIYKKNFCDYTVQMWMWVLNV